MSKEYTPHVFFTVPRKIFNLPNISIQRILFFEIIWGFHYSSYNCVISNDEICRRLKIPLKQKPRVNKLFDYFEKLGVIKREYRYSKITKKNSRHIEIVRNSIIFVDKDNEINVEMEKGSAKNGMGGVPKTARGANGVDVASSENPDTAKMSDSSHTEESPYSQPEGYDDANERNSVIPQDYNGNPTGLPEVEDTIYINIKDNIPPIVPQRGTNDVDVASSENDEEINIEIVEHSTTVEPENDEKSEFDRFWEIYPKKIDKQYAFKCWKRKKTYKHIDVVLEDLNARLKEEWKDKDKTYIKNASTYINRESWRDVLEQRNNITEIETEKQKIKEQLELLKKQRSKK